MATTITQTNQNIDELKEIVSKTLEKQGILAKAQAQLRKHVFEALSSSEQQNASILNVSPKINENDTNDKFAMALIRDFLEYHHLDYTLSLMNTESQKKMEVTQDITRNEIASRLGLGAQKPNPDSSLLKQLVKKLFDSDVFKPRNSTLTDDITLKPRTSTDAYRSSLDSAPSSFIENENTTDSHNTRDRDSLQNLELSLPMVKQLPPLPSQHQASSSLKSNESIENIEIDVDDLMDANSQTDTNKEEQYTDPGDPLDDMLDDLLESSSNEDQDETQNGDAEELKRVETMKKDRERLRLQASECEKLKKESISAVSSQTGTEYEDDFGSDVMEKEIDDIVEEIDETISVEEDEDTVDNIYAAKDMDQAITKNFALENVADIIMDVKTEKIKYQL